MEIGPRYDEESSEIRDGKSDKVISTIHSHRRRINGKVFSFTQVVTDHGATTGVVTIADEEVAVFDRRHSTYSRRERHEAGQD